MFITFNEKALSNVLISDLLDSFWKVLDSNPVSVTVHLTSSMNSYGLTASCFSGAQAVCLKCHKTITLSMELAGQAGCLSGC